MSEILSSWIRALVGAAVFCAVALTLCPKGRAKRVLSTACACVMAIALLSPVAKVDMSSLSQAIGRYSAAARSVTQSAEDASQLYQRRVIERECEAYIMDRADALGIGVASVSVTLRWSSDGFWYPWECTICAGSGYSQALADIVEGELGIGPDRQNWEAVT